MSKKSQQNNISLIPYCEVDGVPTYSDSEILGFYDRMVEAGTAESVFTDGTINSRNDWLKAMKSPENYLYVVYADKDVVALAWLNRVEMKKARLHYSGFFSGWKKGSLKIAKEVMRILMDKKSGDGYLFDMLTGITPLSNKIAIKFMQKVGWKIAGELPFGTWNELKQQSEPAAISYFTKEVWDEDIQ